MGVFFFLQWVVVATGEVVVEVVMASFYRFLWWLSFSILLFKGLSLFGPFFFFGSKIPLQPTFK